MASDPKSLPVGAIKVGKRFRKNLGDIDALADSISRLGLLHPIVVNLDHRLVAGFRRLHAVKKLGWDSVSVRFVHDLKDLDEIDAQGEENTCREDFTPAEAEAYQQARLPYCKKQAEAEGREKKREGGEKGGRGRPADRSGKSFPTPNGEPKRDESARAESRAAETTGYSRTTLAKVTALREAAEEDPEGFGDLFEKTTQPGAKVDALYKELERRQNPPEPAEEEEYPHSELLHRWLTMIQGQMTFLLTEKGDIEGLLAEPDKWDWEDVNAFLLPQIRGLQRILAHYEQELCKHAKNRKRV